MKGRLLEVVLEDPHSNLPLEGDLFVEAEGPTLRVGENQKSVVIGRAQLAKYETDLEYFRRRSIPAVRRMSAGGGVQWTWEPELVLPRASKRRLPWVTAHERCKIGFH